MLRGRRAGIRQEPPWHGSCRRRNLAHFDIFAMTFHFCDAPIQAHFFVSRLPRDKPPCHTAVCDTPHRAHRLCGCSQRRAVGVCRSLARAASRGPPPRQRRPAGDGRPPVFPGRGESAFWRLRPHVARQTRSGNRGGLVVAPRATSCVTLALGLLFALKRRMMELPLSRHWRDAVHET